jgi:hypothetical protein
LVITALRRHLGLRSPEIPTFCERQKGKMTVVMPGRRESHIEERLSDFATHVQRSRAAGATHIG